MVTHQVQKFCTCYMLLVDCCLLVITIYPYAASNNSMQTECCPLYPCYSAAAVAGQAKACQQHQ